MINLNKRGPIMGIIGLGMIICSTVIIYSVLPPNVNQEDDSYIPTMFEGLFTVVSDNIQIISGDSGYFSYTTKSLDVPLLWGIQIIDYRPGDKVSIRISNIFGDKYGDFTLDGQVIFETLDILNSDTIIFEIKNQGSKTINVVVMLSENLDDSSVFSNPNSPVLSRILPLVVSGFLFILGILVILIGIILSFIDWKKIQNDRQNSWK